MNKPKIKANVSAAWLTDKTHSAVSKMSELGGRGRGFPCDTQQRNKELGDMRGQVGATKCLQNWKSNIRAERVLEERSLER